MKHYLYILGLAIIGREPYTKERDELVAGLKRAESELSNAVEGKKKLEEMYCSTLDQWKQAQECAAKLMQQNAKLIKDANGYQALIENLRDSIHEKDELLTEQSKSLGEQIKKLKEKK